MIHIETKMVKTPKGELNQKVQIRDGANVAWFFMQSEQSAVDLCQLIKHNCNGFHHIKAS